jgi:hypothetical protein
MPEIKARFKITGPSGVIADIDILDPEITSFRKEDIKEVKVSPFFPGNPYLESGVAWHWDHACYGSISFFVTDFNDNTEIISPIFFHDKSTTHFGGSIHWNTEFWRYREGNPADKPVKSLPKTNIHQIGKTDWIELEASGTGFPTYKNRLEWEE